MLIVPAAGHAFTIFCIIYRFANQTFPEAVFLDVRDDSMNELWVIYTHRDLCIDLSRLLTARSYKGCTWLKNTASAKSYLVHP